MTASVITPDTTDTMTPARVLAAYVLFESWQRNDTPRQTVLPSRVYEFLQVPEAALKQAVTDKEVYATGLWDRQGTAVAIDDLSQWLEENPSLYTITDEVCEFVHLTEARHEMYRRHRAESVDADTTLRRLSATIRTRRDVDLEKAMIEAAAKTVRDQEEREREQLSRSRRGREILAQRERYREHCEAEAQQKREADAAEAVEREAHRVKREAEAHARQAILRKRHQEQQAEIAAEMKKEAVGAK